ncbi:MAG TPA: hypothetical protein VKR55_11195 [Bradyrhizobium sp.]|uniref:hypothetical protein n=1 Tax=Bradyrhizobium sp. TaxID=376 RepID=UPI002C7A10E4|nr:hypothetical protein [Bradyrhizobium sp.]HLZ02701.1 hypothetical protein [Bradyrhizobium sp.]
MRHTIKGLVAAFAVMTAGAAPAMACGYSPCASYAPVYGYSYAPAYAYTPSYGYMYSSGCGVCGNTWAYDRLAEPTTQYYYVNQGPTYSGPGAFAPAPAYQEDALPYAAPTYGYGYRHYYRPHYHRYHYGYRYGYMPRRYAYRHYWGHQGYYYGRPLVRRYY